MKSTSFALPAPLLAWLDTQAEAKDMSRNAVAIYLLTRAMEQRDAERLSAIEARLRLLEKRHAPDPR